MRCGDRSPAGLGGLNEFEDHREDRGRAAGAAGDLGPKLHGGEGRLEALLSSCAVFGLVGFHADLATPGLGGTWQAAPTARRAELEKLYSTLLTGTEAIGALPASPSWECWRAGRAEGRLIGGVINRIVLAQATRFALPLEWFDGAVLFWEEMGGLASHVWSYLQVLRHCPSHQMPCLATRLERAHCR
jgi:hypothetical protein